MKNKRRKEKRNLKAIDMNEGNLSMQGGLLSPLCILIALLNDHQF